MNDEVITPKETVNNGTLEVTLPPEQPTAAEIELQKALVRIKELEEKQAAKDEALSQSRIDVAAAQAKRGVTKLNNAVSDLQLARAVKECGGPALWATLSAQQQSKALNIEGSEQIKDAEIKKFFDPVAALSPRMRFPNKTLNVIRS